MNELRVVDLGIVPYATGLDWQKELHAKRLKDEAPDVLLLLEHPHVYTLGRRFSREHLLVSDEVLKEKGIDVQEADRGGSITYHGPGQLVAYPIVDLRRPDRDLPDAIRYLRVLEEAIIRTVRSFGVMATRREGNTGVWVGENKLAAIGVNVSRGVSRHGLALNVSTDLEFFAGMVPCGISGAGVTSLAGLLGAAPSIDEVKGVLARNLAKLLYRRVVNGNGEDLGLVSENLPEVVALNSRKRRAARKTDTGSPGSALGGKS
ncbi:MAG TPA: lipoyl(octanoyl) transferase LipB [Actinomycetota bacterium]|nr:lipoyl(octanoyl) transferase LipB [Actinomycetota bacterium]